jgi:hypothetical protein
VIMGQNRIWTALINTEIIFSSFYGTGDMERE